MKTWFVSLLSACGIAHTAVAALNITALSPANGATNVCTDTPLRITFDSAPNYGSVSIANSERITIYAQDGTPVDVIDMSLNVNKTGSTNVQPRFISATNGSANSFFTFPIIVTGNTATIFPHNVALTNNQTYYVNITSQLFTNSANGNFPGISDSTTWSFTTKPAKPPTGTNELVVAADGTGDFCTLQGALDYLPAVTGQHILVNVRNGIYEEIVWLNNKTNITIRGENRKQTILRYRNNEPLNPGANKRCLLHVSGDSCALENMTITNSTPKGGGQAEAFRMAGRRFIANNCDFDSYQDTIVLNSSARYSYFYNCLVQGDTDFIWNDACAVFQSCEIKSLSSSGYVCNMRTPDLNHHGAIFLDCMFTKAPGVSANTSYLNRINTGDGPASEVVLINCRMDNHILPVGWQLSGSTNDVRFREYQSTNIAGTAAIDVSSRAAFSSQITEAQAKAYRNLTNVYAINLRWLPQLAPNIISQPADLTVDPGSNATFTVEATGIETADPLIAGDPSIIVPLSFQWLKNGTNVTGATNASLTISNAQTADAGTYSLVVSNLSGSMVSSNALLVVEVPNQPVIQSVLFTNSQFSLTFNGDSGPNYGVQSSSNLIDWQTVFTTNAPGLPFVWTDTDTTAPERFYRILVNP